MTDATRKPEREWFKCQDCGQQVLREANGSEHYHSGVCGKPTRPKAAVKKPERHSTPRPSGKKSGKSVSPKGTRSV